MSLFGGLGGFFDDDPFFGSHLRQMSQMNRMMDPFDMFGGFGARSHGSAMMPFGFPNLNMVMDRFKMGMDNPNCHSFSSSTVMTMTNGPDGKPQIYQESRSTRCAPGGVKETKKAVCDSRTGTKRLAIGHHIGERGHVRERVQNVHSGEQEESEDFINLEEDEAEDFNREWHTRTRDIGRSAIGYRNVDRSDQRRHRALPAITSGNRYHPSSSTNSPKRQYPALSNRRSSDEIEITEITDEADEPPEERPRKRAREPEATKTAPEKKMSKQHSSKR